MIRKTVKAVWAFPLIRIFAFLVLLVFSLIVSERFLYQLLETLHTPHLAVELCSYVLQFVVCLGLTALFVRKFEHLPLSEFGLRKECFHPDFLLGVLYGALPMVLIVAVMYGMNLYSPQKFNSAQDLLISGSALIFAAASEELIFRAYTFNVLERAWGTITALAISSIGFGFAHMVNEPAGTVLADRLLFCTFLSFEAGLMLAACYVFTRRLWMPISAHWMWNFFEGPVFGTHVSGTDFGRDLIDANITGPVLLTGGKFGPEGSVICLVIGTVFGVGLLWFAAKRNRFISYAEARQGVIPPEE